MSRIFSFFAATAAPGWDAERLSFSGIVFRIAGSFASLRETQGLFDSGRASSASTRGARRRSLSVLAARAPGGCFPSRAGLWLVGRAGPVLCPVGIGVRFLG